MTTRETPAAAMMRIAKVMKSSAAGPLIAGIEVMKVADRWGEYSEKETGGLSAEATVFKYLGLRLAFFKARARAVEVLGRDCISWAEHTLAVRLSNIADPKLRTRVVERVLEVYADKRAQNLYVTMTQAKQVLAEVIGKTPRQRGGCERCRQYRALLKQHAIADTTRARGPAGGEVVKCVEWESQ